MSQRSARLTRWPRARPADVVYGDDDALIEIDTLGTVYSFMGQQEKAIAALGHGLELNPSSALAYGEEVEGRGPAREGTAKVLRSCQKQVTVAIAKGITIKLPEATLQRLKDEARETGRSIAALVRERVEAVPGPQGRSVYALASDLAGCVAGSRRSATNRRRKFRRP